VPRGKKRIDERGDSRSSIVSEQGKLHAKSHSEKNSTGGKKCQPYSAGGGGGGGKKEKRVNKRTKKR